MFKIDDGSCVYQEKGGPDPIHDIAFGKDSGSMKLWSAGVKHLNFYDLSAGKKKKGIFGDKERVSFACITADDKGTAYSGGTNAQVYLWNGNTCKTTLAKHAPVGFVGAIMWNNGKLYSGGKDGRVVIVNTDTMEAEKAFTFGELIRAIDVKDNLMVVGLRTGSIIQTDLDSDEQRTFVQSHNSGEVWGLDIAEGKVFTSGDDN